MFCTIAFSLGVDFQVQKKKEKSQEKSQIETFSPTIQSGLDYKKRIQNFMKNILLFQQAILFFN
jgi:hypothetical protein